MTLIPLIFADLVKGTDLWSLDELVASFQLFQFLLGAGFDAITSGRWIRGVTWQEFQGFSCIFSRQIFLAIGEICIRQAIVHVGCTRTKPDTPRAPVSRWA